MVKKLIEVLYKSYRIQMVVCLGLLVGYIVSELLAEPGYSLWALYGIKSLAIPGLWFIPIIFMVRASYKHAKQILKK